MTGQRKLRRKEEPTAGRRHLRLVKPRRRRRFKIGRVWKVKFPPELLRYEEDIVYDAIVALDHRTTVEALMKEWPERFRRKQLWWALLRLVDQERLHTSQGLGLLGLTHRQRGGVWDWAGASRAWFERYRVQPEREFWTYQWKKGRDT